MINRIRSKRGAALAIVAIALGSRLGVAGPSGLPYPSVSSPLVAHNCSSLPGVYQDVSRATVFVVGQARGGGPRRALPVISIPATTAPESCYAALARIGIRELAPSVWAAPTGDLVVALRVTRRERGYETFGYPPIKQFWTAYARLPDPP